MVDADEYPKHGTTLEKVMACARPSPRMARHGRRYPGINDGAAAWC